MALSFVNQTWVLADDLLRGSKLLHLCFSPTINSSVIYPLFLSIYSLLLYHCIYLHSISDRIDRTKWLHFAFPLLFLIWFSTHWIEACLGSFAMPVLQDFSLSARTQSSEWTWQVINVLPLLFFSLDAHFVWLKWQHGPWTTWLCQL